MADSRRNGKPGSDALVSRLGGVGVDHRTTTVGYRWSYMRGASIGGVVLAVAMSAFTSSGTSAPTSTSLETSTPSATIASSQVTVTSFSETLSCDPAAEDADLQVVQAFITAYNQRNAGRLQELVEDQEIWDLGGVPHLGDVLWTDALAWAEKGWLVDDRLELIRVIRYGPKAGSDVTVRRTNDVLREAGISELILMIKVPSSGCTIKRLIAHVSAEEAGGCLFFETYIDRLQDQEYLTDIEVPDRCTT